MLFVSSRCGKVRSRHLQNGNLADGIGLDAAAVDGCGLKGATFAFLPGSGMVRRGEQPEVAVLLVRTATIPLPQDGLLWRRSISASIRAVTC